MIENKNIVGSDIGNITTEVTTCKDTYVIESRIEKATELTVENGFANSGDTVVVAAGMGQVGSTNLLKVTVIE